MNTWLVAGVVVSAGLAGCFFGRRAFRPLLPLLGGLFALALAGQAVGPEDDSLVWLLATGVVVVLAVLAYAASPALTVEVGGTCLALGAGALIGSSLGLPSVPAVTLALLTSAAFLLLPRRSLEQRMVISTAFAGAALALYGLGLVFPPTTGPLGRLRDLVVVGNWLVLGLIGVSTQVDRALLPVPVARRRAARLGR
jgi:hypothetical protein